MPAIRLLKTLGFTLTELMIAIAIVAILAGIALPSYQSHVQKSKLRAAQADAVALSLAIENVYQRKLSYTVMTDAPLADIKAAFTSWSPTSKVTDFAFTLTSTANSYTITATAQAGSGISGCNISLDNGNNRSLGASCKYGSEWY
jgi:type IV pilus assembly protein PilE